MIVLDAVRKSFSSGSRRFDLDIPEIEVSQGSMTYLVGPNGSGKSLYFSELESRSTSEYLSEVVLIRQSPDDNIANSLSVIENMSLWLRSSDIVDFIQPTRRLARRVREWEEEFPILRGVWGQASVSLSGGQKQIISMISRLQRKPDLLLLDEAFSSVDEAILPGAKAYLEGFVAKNSCACIAISHDISHVAASGADVLLFSGGKLVTSISRSSYLHSTGATEMRRDILDAWREAVLLEPETNVSK